ncbi:MAG: ABC transporter ATP-binding protein [Oscillospiraceae bacterium]|nr:ABC transporter ATP-binding protein [Oscillospiraceae bacterium]
MKNPTVTTLLRHSRGRVFLLTALSLLMSLLQVALAVLSRSVIDAALAADGKLGSWTAGYIITVLLLVVAYAAAAWLNGSTVDVLSARLREDLLRSAMYSRDLRLQQFHSGQLLSRGMEDVHTLCDGAVNALPALVGQLGKLAAAFIAVSVIAPKVALLLVAVAVVVVLATACMRPLLKKQHEKVRQSDEKVMSTMQEDLQQLELIQSLQVQEKLLAGFSKVVGKNLHRRARRRIWTVTSNSLFSTASLLGTGALLIWGATQVANGTISFGMLTAMLQLLSLFSGPVLGLSGLWTRFTAVEVAAQRLSELLVVPDQPAQVTAPITVEQIVFEDVTFAYPGEETPVVEHFSAAFPLDRWACLTGISGRGKTTLFKLVLGLYTPQAGRVYLQTPQGQVPCSEQTRHLFAYVPQDYALFSGSVRFNLELVADSDAAVHRNALELAQADFLADEAAEEQTQVRENNTGLSKGQLQRLAIARAILMERPVLLLDECTSALDAKTEQAVLRSLHGLGTKAVLVTHRPEALQELPELGRVDI